MHQSTKRRSHSIGSLCEESIDQCKKKNCEESKADDLKTACQLLLCLLHTKDASDRSYLHTNFRLSWAKTLLERARTLDEYCSQHMDSSMTRIDSCKNRCHRSGSNSNKESISSRATNVSAGSANGKKPLLQLRFLLQPNQESGYTPFHRAIIERNLAAVLLFLRYASADEKSAERLAQRPMTLLHAAEVQLSRNRTDMKKNDRSSNNLLLAMANATDHEGMTPLCLLGQLQQSELSRCRNYVKSFQQSVDRNTTMIRRTLSRRSSFDNNRNDSDDENFQYFSEDAEVLRIDDEGIDDRANGFVADNAAYACEVVTFGRPNHYALGVVQNGSSSSSASVSSSTKDCGFCPKRVQEFAQEIVGRQGSAMTVAVATHHSLVVTKHGHLYAFGLGKGGRLGIGDDQPQQCPLPKRVLGPLQRRKVVGVAAAENHSLCVTSQGDIYSWGSNRFGQLGDNGTGSSSTLLCGSRCVPRRVESLKHHPCVGVAAGEKHSVALSRKGEVFVWGDNTSGQLGVSRRTGIQKVQRVEALWKASGSRGNKNSSPNITIAIAAAAQSTLVLTTGSPSSRLTNVNAIYEWGHGNHVPIRVHFESYNAETKKKDGNNYRSSSFGSSFSRTPNPTAIACARYHNAAITSDGMVYTWGLHEESLGRSNKSDETKQQQYQRRNSSPQLVTGMLPEKGGGNAVAIDASGSHTAVVCSNGALYTWGTNNGKNVLGHEGVRWQPNPKRVPGVHRAIDVAVAKEHTILLIGASFPSMPKNNGLQGLDVLAARKVAEYVDLFNVVPILMMSERIQSSFLIEYCTNFVRRNLDGVLNVGKKSVMDQYLNDMLAETTHLAGKRYRDGHHHPMIFDVIAAGNAERPAFDRDWFSSPQEWIQGCKELVQNEVVRRLIMVARSKEDEEDSRISDFKTRRRLLYQKEQDESNDKTRHISKSLLIPEVKEGNLDRGIKRTANMDLSTIGLAKQNAAWLTKEIRGIKKKLKQISSLLYADTRKVVLSVEQEAKVSRRPTLEVELSIYESALEEVTKRMKELNIENDTKKILLISAEENQYREELEAQHKMIETKEHESCLVSNTKKLEDSIESIPDQRDEKRFFCDICNVKCSDKSNFILHQNGRKHRNRAAQLVEEEKEVTATLIRQQQQIELMKSASIPTPPRTNIAKKAWGTKTSPQPMYLLPPPPHPVLAHVVSTSYETPLHDMKSPVSTTKPLSLFSKYNGEAQNFSDSIRKKTDFLTGIDSSSSNDISAAPSNFMTVSPEQKKLNTMLHRRMKESQKLVVRDTSLSSSRTVPSSLTSARDHSFTPDKIYIEAQNREERPSRISLADFLTPTKKKLRSKSHTAPWMKRPTSAMKTLSTVSPRSIVQIQAQEESLKSKQDKSYGEGGGSWYIERRERAESVLEIQKLDQEDLEHRLLVEEQLKIEAQIREENDRRQQIEATKKKSRKDGCNSKRRKKKSQKSRNTSKNTSKKIDSKCESSVVDTRKSNRSTVSAKSTKNS